MQGIVVGRAHDARLIKTVETVDDDTFKVGGQIWHTLGKVGTELANRLALYLIVVVEIRLEHAQQGVSLLLQGLIGLIDREIVFCDDRAIMPWLSNLILELLGFIAGHEPHDQHGGCQHQQQPQANVAPMMLFTAVKLFYDAHKLTIIWCANVIFLFTLRKY